MFFADNQEVLIVRTANDPATLASAVRRTIAAIDPTQPIVKIATMEQVVAASTSQRRLALVLFGAFAAALLLAIAGIYGVLAGSVSERTREIGVRSALGATPSSLIGLIVGQGGRLAAIGLHDLANRFTNGRVDVRPRFKELRLAEAVLQPCLDALIQDLLGHAICWAGSPVAQPIPT